MTLATFIASMGGIGRLRPAPGSWGSALVLPLVLLGPAACLWLGLGLAVLGTVAIARALGAGPEKDPGWVVVDEGAGMLVALAGLPAHPGWAGVAAAFLLFRLLDIAKPWPISWIDRRDGVAGVMLDDLLAGGIAAVALILLDQRWPGVL